MFLLAVAVLAWAPAAPAALPKPNTTYQVHDHSTPGERWHVETKTTQRGRGLATIVVYSERCGTTPYGRRVPVGADGTTRTHRPIDPSNPDKGSWAVDARFTEPHRLEGYFRIVTPTCDTGPIGFVAHSGKHHGRAYGHAPGTMPDLGQATPRRLAEARALYRDSLRAASRRFETYEAAAKLGYQPYDRIKSTRGPLLFHVRNTAYDSDERELDARRVESLVYYRGEDERPVLVAFMYRQPAQGWPPFGRPLLAWHAHGSGKTNQMTHVWLTGDLRSALANCMPVEQLEQALPAYDYVPTEITVPESRPCPAGA